MLKANYTLAMLAHPKFYFHFKYFQMFNIFLFFFPWVQQVVSILDVIKFVAAAQIRPQNGGGRLQNVAKSQLISTEAPPLN